MKPTENKETQEDSLRFNPNDIYPVVEERYPNYDVGTDNTEKPKLKNGIWHTIIGFLTGFMGMAVLSILLGLIFNGTLISHGREYFGSFEDGLSIIFIGPIVMTIFGVIALINKDWIFLIYPPVAYLIIGPWLQGTDLAHGLAGFVPIEQDESSRYNLYLITIVIAYLMIYVYERSASSISRRGRFKEQVLTPQDVLAQVGILSIFSITMVTLLAAGGLINNAAVASKQIKYKYIQNDKFSLYIDPTSSMAYINYSEPTAQYEGSYNIKDPIHFYKLKASVSKDTKKACGDSKSYPELPSQNSIYKHKKTSSGVDYAEAEFSGNSAKPYLKTTAYSIYHFCFVADGQKYDLERTNAHGDDYLKKYPTDTVIDDIVHASSYNKCDKEERIICSKDDISKTKQSLQQNKKQSPPTGLLAVGNNPDAYKQVGKLDIKEWGVSIPLSEEIKDAYYSYSSQSDIVTVSLASNDSGYCKNSQSYGLSYVRRSPADNKVNPNIKGVSVIGAHQYKIYGSGNMRKCVDQQTAEILDDVFVWSSINIKPIK